MGLLIDELLEQNDGTLLDLYEIDRDLNYGVKRSVGIYIDSMLGIVYGSEIECVEDG